MAEAQSSTQTQAPPRRRPLGGLADGTLDAGNPFPGPKPYRRDQEKLFFGRSNEVEELTSLVLSTSAVLLYAQSGSGKSSLLQAGLAPGLEGFSYQILPTVRFGRAGLGPPGDRAEKAPPNPFVELICDTVLPEESVTLPGTRDLGQLAAHLRDSNDGASTLLILDQFEELFANQALWQERGAFLAQLRSALDANPWLHAVIAIRSDYLANLLPYERELPGRILIRYGLESLREQAAREAIAMAFERTDVSLTTAEMDRVLDRLLSLDVGPPGSHVKGQYVNLIQLQILCRRLWREKAEPRSQSDPGTSDGSGLLQGSEVDLAGSMQSFVDDALTGVVTQTQSDEGVVRRWLEDRLITPAGRRAVLLVDNEQTAGLPQEVLDALEDARLIQVEQRNQSQYAELTHDSMVAAVRGSNNGWVRARRRTRHWLTAALLVALVGLLALFFFVLRTPRTGGTLLTSAHGAVPASGLSIPFRSAPKGHVAVVHVSLIGRTSAGATVSVVATDQGKEQGKELTRRVATATDGRVRTSFIFAINTTQPASYAVSVKAPNLRAYPRGRDFLDYAVTVRSAPMSLDVRDPADSRGVTVHSPLFVVKLYPGQPLYLQILDARLRDVWNARTLLKSGADEVKSGADEVVLESPGRAGYAVLRLKRSGGRVPTAEVGGGLVEQGTRLQPGAQVHIRAVNGSVSSVHIDKAYAPFAVEKLCRNNDNGDLHLTDSEGRSVSSTAQSVPGDSVLVPAARVSDYRLFLLPSFGPALNCRVFTHSFAQQRITAMSSRRVKIPANSSFNAYLIRIPADAVIIVDHLKGAPASLDCLANNITESTGGRLLALVPGNHNCVLSIGRSFLDNGRKTASFPLLIVPVPRG